MKRAVLFTLTFLFVVATPAFSKGKVSDLEKGKKLFEKNLCAECHKNGGNSVRPSKPIKGSGFARKYRDDKKLEALIRQGVPNASMPSYGVSVISDDEMKCLIMYVRSFTKEKKSANSKSGKTKKK